jgi:hypothetical protein
MLSVQDSLKLGFIRSNLLKAVQYIKAQSFKQPVIDCLSRADAWDYDTRRVVADIENFLRRQLNTEIV